MRRTLVLQWVIAVLAAHPSSIEQHFHMHVRSRLAIHIAGSFVVATVILTGFPILLFQLAFDIPIISAVLPTTAPRGFSSLEEVKMSKRGASAAADQIVKLIVGAGQASPSPPIGPALGSRGVKSMDFCKEFNARTAHILPSTPMPIRVTVRADRSFHFDIRTPHTSWLLRNAAGLPVGKNGKRKAANKPGHEIVGTVSLKHIYEIAKIKQSELRLSGLPLKGICNAVIFQAKSMGIDVVA